MSIEAPDRTISEPRATALLRESCARPDRNTCPWHPPASHFWNVQNFLRKQNKISQLERRLLDVAAVFYSDQIALHLILRNIVDMLRITTQQEKGRERTHGRV